MLFFQLFSELPIKKLKSKKKKNFQILPPPPYEFLDTRLTTFAAWIFASSNGGCHLWPMFCLICSDCFGYFVLCWATPEKFPTPPEKNPLKFLNLTKISQPASPPPRKFLNPLKVSQAPAPENFSTPTRKFLNPSENFSPPPLKISNSTRKSLNPKKCINNYHPPILFFFFLLPLFLHFSKKNLNFFFRRRDLNPLNPHPLNTPLKTTTLWQFSTRISEKHLIMYRTVIYL